MNLQLLTINGDSLTIDAAAPFIFLVEDDVDDQELLIEAIGSHDKSMQVHAVSNGKKAMVFLENLPDAYLPCLIVLDYNLPEANGAQVLQFLSHQERYHTIPKIIWSTSNSPVYREACLKSGAKAYFTKPSDFSSISTLAKELLEFCDKA